MSYIIMCLFAFCVYAGYASNVVDARCKLTGEHVALKVYNTAELVDMNRVNLHREVRLHTALDHPNILKVHAAFMVSWFYSVTPAALSGIGTVVCP